MIAIENHPTVDGTTLFELFGAPNCESTDCTFYSDYSTFSALIPSQDRRGGYFYFSCNLYDNLWTEYGFAVYPGSCSDNSDISTCSYSSSDTAEAWTVDIVSIYEGDGTSYYEGFFSIPLNDIMSGNYVVIRYDPSQGEDDTAEIISSVYLDEIGGLADIGDGEGGGNSGTVVLKYSEDWFLNDIEFICFDLVEDYISVDFTDPPSHIDPVVRSQHDYIYIQAE